MTDKPVPMYFGDDFGFVQMYPESVLLKWLQDGEVEEARMPRPTKKHPDRSRLVYRWKGERTFDHRGLSAQMPPCVTELAAEGVSTFVACADAWHGHITPEFRGLRRLPAGIRLLVNVVAPA